MNEQLKNQIKELKLRTREYADSSYVNSDAYITARKMWETVYEGVVVNLSAVLARGDGGPNLTGKVITEHATKSADDAVEAWLSRWA